MFFKSFFKKTQFLILLMAIFMPWQMKAQETLTVCDGTAPGTTTNTCNYVPLYGSYVDTQGTTSEFIIPAETEGMDELVGGVISKLTFYITNSPASWGSPTIKVYMGEVEGTTISSLYGPSDFTVVATCVLNNTQSPFEVVFDTPYTYEGGNLLIGTYVQAKSDTYKTTTFAGITAPSGSSRNNNGSGIGTAREFLPKTTFTYTPAAGGVCQKPSVQTPENITSSSATISWTNGSGTYNVEYKKASDSDWTVRETNYSATSVELTGLEPNTSYQARVQSVCDGDAVSAWATTNFETPCVSVETFPYHEDFNNLNTNGEIPDCWNNEEGTTTNESYRWCYNSNYGTGHEGKCVRFDSYSNSKNNTNFLKTPVVSLPQNPAMQLRFWCKNPAGGDFSVYISTDGGATHDTELITGLTGITEWTEETIDLSNYKGEENVVIVFKGTSNYGSNDARLYLDDVFIEEAPSCPKQNGLHVTAVTSSSVTLDWTAGTNEQDHWDVFITDDENVKPDANTTTTVVNTDQKPYTHIGLNPETVYFAFVRARCSDTDQSLWTDACRFVTPQIPVVVDGNHPYDNDFETTCGWLFVNGDRPNQWWYGSAANNTPNGDKAIYISNDGGVSNTYTNTKSVVYATKALSFAEGVYNFSYDWRAKGNQNYDYIRVALAPASYEIVATDNLPTGLSDTQLPTGWIALDGGSKLNNNVEWSTKLASEIQVPAGEYKMVVVWRNLTYTISQPPAAIDNISISMATCPRPTALHDTEVGGRTATVVWTENGTATSWVLQYATNSSFTESLEEVSVSENPSKELTGLTPETHYYIRVKSVVGSDESLWSDVDDFTTLATCPKPTLSYVYNSNTAYTGSVTWTGSTADVFEIAYRPTSDFEPSDYTLTDVTRVQLENVTEYNYTLENLTPETKYYIYIQTNCGAEDGLSLWSNRVIFTTKATCQAPSSITKDATTSTSITVHWTKGSDDQDAWQFRYKKTSDSEYTYILVENHPSNSYTIEGLTPSTEYKVNVRAYCSSTDQSKWCYADQSYDLTVATDCGELTLPYTYGFEENVQTTSPYSTSCPYPKCWDRIAFQSGYYSNYTYYPYVFSANYSNPYAHGGDGTTSTSGHCLYFYQTSSSTNECAVLPEISSDYEMSDIQIRFWAAVRSSQGTMKIGVMTSPTDAGTFTLVQEVTISNTYDSGFQEFTVPLSTYTGTGRYIAFMCGTGSSYAYFLIDDITVELIPTCWVPTALTVKETSYNSASLTWNAGKDETEWNLQYKKSSENEWCDPIHVTELPTNENPYVLTDLKRGTDYDVRVQAYCNADDQSEWCNAISFTTECGIWPIDNENALFEGFSGDAFPPACWDLYKDTQYYGWQRNIGASNPLGQDGTAYSYWPDESYLLLPHMHIEGLAQLQFDMAFSDSGSGEECSVVLSTTGSAKLDFTTTLWTATSFPTTRTSVNVDLSAYNGQDVYIAFKFVGNSYSGRLWYVDNVGVYCTSYPNEVQGYTTDADGWRLIASPLAETILANDVLNLTAGDFDLYRFNQNSDNEWENWKSEGSAHYHFGLQPGRGYLYANNTNTTLTFIGTVYSGNGEVTLCRNPDAQFAGWNLIGNPFAQSATMAKDFYVMTSDGSDLIASEGHQVAAMEGIMVYTETDGEVVKFVKNARNTVADEQIVLNLSRYEGDVIDRVIVRFGEGGTLPKYSLNDNNAKIYVTQNGADYAVLRGCGMGEMPVSFEAKHLGKYTFDANVEIADVSYLHLVDKVTGDDVDILNDGSYTFIASPADRKDRFVLRFSNYANATSDVFAYQNGDDITVIGEGELQIFDVTGRMVSTNRVTGVETMCTSSLQTGVYILKLEGKTQKIVVR